MSNLVHEDMVKGSVNVSLGNGIVATRVFVVSQITGNRDAIMFNAAINGQLPKLGDLHPSIPEVRVDNIESTPLGAAECEISILYKILSPGPVDEDAETVLNMGATVQSVKTNKFFVGRKQQLMVLKYTYPPGKSPNGVDEEFSVVPTADRQVAMPFVSLSRREAAPPLQKSVDFVGTMNSRTFFGTKPKTWLCTKIVGVSNDSGLTYEVNYEFLYRSETWDTDLAFTDEETGRIPADIESQPEALKKFQLQLKADFGRLKVERTK